MNRIPLRTLKILTTIFIVIPCIMMATTPWVLRRTPRNAGPGARREVVRRVALYGFLLGGSAVLAGIGAYSILRREQAIYREKALANMKDLIEATRQDRINKQKEEAPGPDAER